MIHSIKALKVLDSRGNWTIEVKVNGYSGIAPSGASVGKYEALAINVDKAVKIVNTELQQLVGKPLNQEVVDKLLIKIDKTPDFSYIGGNTATAISFAVYKAILAKKPLPKENQIFPLPLTNVFGGGAHGGFSSIQEFLICPVKAKTIVEAIQTNEGVYESLKQKLNERKVLVGVNDESALTAQIDDLAVLDLISKIAEEHEARVGLDIAASYLYDGKAYKFNLLNKLLLQKEQIDFVLDLIKTYKLFYVEDPLHEEDFAGFKELTAKAGHCLVCGDDLFVTNYERLKKGIQMKAASAVIIKPNQIGTITQTLKTVHLAKKYGYVPVVAHRSAETSDTTISYLTVEWNIPMIKTGLEGIRSLKWNELIKLWDETERPKMAELKII